MGGFRAAMSDQLVTKSGDARTAQMMTKTSGKLRTDACSAAVASAAAHAGTRARALAAPGAHALLARGPRGPRRRGGARGGASLSGGAVQPRPKQEACNA
eukprot:7949500-Pyramimonas_sp.AAC.1